MTKKPLAWIVDSTAYISEELKQHPDFFSVPLNIHFGEKQFVDGVDLTSRTTIRENKECRRVSENHRNLQPENLPNNLKSLRNSMNKPSRFMFPRKLSGTLASSKAGAEIAGFPVTFIDSLALSYGITGLIEQGMEMYDRRCNCSRN